MPPSGRASSRLRRDPRRPAEDSSALPPPQSLGQKREQAIAAILGPSTQIRGSGLNGSKKFGSGPKIENLCNCYLLCFEQRAKNSVHQGPTARLDIAESFCQAWDFGVAHSCLQLPQAPVAEFDENEVGIGFVGDFLDFSR